jgi:hypothetical protein
VKRPILIFGIAAGLAEILYFLILFMIYGDFSHMRVEDLQRSEILGYLRYVILFVGIVMAMVTYRRSTSGEIGYRRMLAIGVQVGLIAALFVGALEFSYVAFISPDFYDQYVKITIEQARRSGATPAQLKEFAAQQANFAWMRNPWPTGAFYFAETAVLSTVFSLLAALVVRRKATGDEDRAVEALEAS